jgi:hypothetical protein
MPPSPRCRTWLSERDSNVRPFGCRRSIRSGRAVATLQRFVTAEGIVQAAQLVGSLYYRNRLDPRDACPPREPVNHWHFEHATIGDCSDRTRNSLPPHAMGIENPSHDSWDILILGCETMPQRNRQNQLRRLRLLPVIRGNDATVRVSRASPMRGSGTIRWYPL